MLIGPYSYINHCSSSIHSACMLLVLLVACSILPLSPSPSPSACRPPNNHTNAAPFLIAELLLSHPIFFAGFFAALALNGIDPLPSIRVHSQLSRGMPPFYIRDQAGYRLATMYKAQQDKTRKRRHSEVSDDRSFLALQRRLY
jgi:hypothetical protein